MKKRKSSKASLGDVAKAAGVSKTAAGFALQNRAGVSRSTRRRILKIARQLNYAPDARLATRMTAIRQVASKDLLPIVWFNTNKEKDTWHKYKFHTPYLEGARERAFELGYRIEEIWMWQPGLTMRRISQIIYQQGIEGIIVSDPARHMRLNMDHLASVCIGGGLLLPALHRITTDIHFNLLLAFKSLKRFGYRRIGICLTQEAERFSGHVIASMVLYFDSITPKSQRIPPLFFPYLIKDEAKGMAFAAWLKRERPEVVIGLDNRLVQWAKNAGFRVPDELGIVHLAIEDDVLDWAGIYANKREVGRLAAESVISLIQNRQFGVPVIPSTRLVRGSWQNGRTLLIPRTE
ncbi:MAG: LacI family DNA-binding transcriptional regulator [Methylacidiphilales bacterium]|nr:LacI family DNA-binding transcriptional regulator [Candidatus Methylacidiphilales bacterium]